MLQHQGQAGRRIISGIIRIVSTIPDPTLENQVGNDRGTQYRHGIYTHGEAQAEEAARTLAGAGGGSNLPVQTEVEAAERWWPAEDYHQQYLQKGGQSARKQAAETIRCYG